MTTSMTMARTALGALLTLGLLPALWPDGAAAHTCDAPFSTNLIAGQTIDAGDVKVCNDDTTLTVTYEATFPWCLLKTDLHVATVKSGIPHTNNGNPKPDEFAFGEEYGGCLDGPATFEIPLADVGDDGVSSGDTVFIAAHAGVENGAREAGAWGKGSRFVQRGNWAMYFTYEVQEPPPATSCVCDGRTGLNGTTGAAILAQLCPGGARAPGVVFHDGQTLVDVFNTDPRTLGYLATANPSSASCALQDDPGGSLGYTITLSEAQACLAHLRVSCGQPEP